MRLGQLVHHSRVRAWKSIRITTRRLDGLRTSVNPASARPSHADAFRILSHGGMISGETRRVPKAARPPPRGNAMTPQLTVDATMDILRTTVPRLAELTDGVPEPHVHAITDYGWSVNDQLAHLRACHDVLGGNMLRIVREGHPAWRGMSPGSWQKQTDYFEWQFRPAFEEFRAQRAELLEVVEALPPEAWECTATVTGGSASYMSTASSTTATGWPATSAATCGTSPGS
jgi:hypothetical protein